MAIAKKTWPYGTKRRAKVRGVETEGMTTALVVQDELGEAHILIGTGSVGEEGDRGTITFLQGGPMGGYWKFEKQ